MAELDELTAQCIRCGFCLESCPTFVITSDESQSPRGRIQLARSFADSGEWDDGAEAAIDSCLGCRACETACPSGVQYGKILELARRDMPKSKQSGARRLMLRQLSSPKIAALQFRLAEFYPGNRMPRMLSSLLSGERAEAEIPKIPEPALFPPLEESDLPPVRGEVYLLLGCVMHALYPHVHEATRRLLRRVGFSVREIDPVCCGAMQAHSGYLQDAEEQAQKLAKAFSEDLPIVVNAAGCGSTIKEYGQLIGEGLAPVGKRSIDIIEFLSQQGLEEMLVESRGLPGLTITYHDACHLIHGQRISAQPRRLLQSIPGINFVELKESAMCCGSAGTYNIFQPKMARTLLERKWRNIEMTSANILASGNPGCDAWIAQAAREKGADIRVMHTADVLESSFVGLER
ncbi:(Fe-S)-binding protein [Kamptonema cortianum]|nr:(Fe-S)-binding protein [Kamptonema cortianum]